MKKQEQVAEKINNSYSYRKLQIKPSVGWWVGYYVQHYTGVVMAYIPFIAKIIYRIGYEIALLGASGKVHDDNLKYIKQLKKNDNYAKNAQFESPYGYKGDLQELEIVRRYNTQLKNPDFKNDICESSALYEHVISKLSQIFDKGKISGFVNFGVAYGYIDSMLAKKYPHIEFIGIDRSRFTKLYNETQFSEIKNLKFIAGDIFELLHIRRFDNYIFFHTRTCLLLPPSFITELYKAVLSAGFSYVVGMEQIGVSRETSKAFEFSDRPVSSVLFRGSMFIHNYPGILKESGWKLEEIELVKTKHPHEDFRILSFIAKK